MATSLADPYFFHGTAPHSADIVLYVDFDGVLHHEEVFWSPRRGPFMSPAAGAGRTLFEWAHYLESVLAEFPAVGLVLSSTWCVRPGFSKAIKRLEPDLRNRFLGGTFHRRHHGADPWILESFRNTSRWKQILADAQRRKPRAWLALDDDVDGWPEDLLSNLVACDGATGLSSPQVRNELTEKLRQLTSSLENGK